MKNKPINVPSNDKIKGLKNKPINVPSNDKIKGVKNKQKNNHLPIDIIKGLGLSFKDIAKRCDDITKKYSPNIDISSSFEQLISNQKVLRRDLSNWVNNAKNLVNSKKEYIGHKFGARITVVTSDGRVIHDVETFCRDVNNVNNRILGTNNNYIFFKTDLVQVDNVENQLIPYSTLKIDNIKNSNIKYRDYSAYKVNSSSLPSSNDICHCLLKYSPDDTTDGDVVAVESGTKIELHTTRKEMIEAVTLGYGYDSRLSNTSNSRNYYVCKYITKNGISFFIRLSYFDFPPPTTVDVLAAGGDFKTLVTALKSANLVKTLSSQGPFTIFAPTDAAFAQLSSTLPTNPAILQNILKYHVVLGKFVTADLVKLERLPTLAPSLNISISVVNNNILINNSKVIKSITCSNGVIHVIDTVLTVPNSNSIITIIPENT